MKNMFLPEYSDTSIDVKNLIDNLKNQKIQSGYIFDLLKSGKLAGDDFLQILTIAEKEMLKGGIVEIDMDKILRKSLEIQAAARGIKC